MDVALVPVLYRRTILVVFTGLCNDLSGLSSHIPVDGGSLQPLIDAAELLDLLPPEGTTLYACILGMRKSAAIATGSPSALPNRTVL